MNVAHPARAPAPHDLYTAWNLDPLLVVGFLVALWIYRRGHVRRRSRQSDGRRNQCFYAALAVLALALLSPLDAIAHALASAHMVQHILLLLVAAPLLAFSAPWIVLLRGSPSFLRRGLATSRQRLWLTARNTRILREPVPVWLLHVGTLWFWHAAIPYDAALANPLLHAIEHGMFLVTGVMFWRVVIRSRYVPELSPGSGVLLVFGMAIQSGFLAALLTFARSPWYSSYASTTAAWNLDPLADQQLAGVIMWIPAGFVYLAAALALLTAWTSDPDTAEGRVGP